jgi:hypothetical protein
MELGVSSSANKPSCRSVLDFQARPGDGVADGVTQRRKEFGIYLFGKMVRILKDLTTAMH